jgi:GAF domain-containing protein
MDSTLLDQVRHLCRDRAAYEHLKAILVQQERVHQISWEERYEKLIAAQSSDSQTDIFSNIIAREKAIAQLADAIQRSPSLELVLQIAVQVAQKLLQVDRVAIFRCYPDGRGEFTTDAIASGLTSLADMPERQLSLARHMIEATDPEQSAQTIDSIRTSSLSSHIVTLLEQIGISSYAANKIYAGQDVWGTLVAFHGSVYHSWSESDRTSLSLIAAQIGIAISLTNLRQQSQELTNDLQTLQIELDNLQQTVAELAEKSANSTDDQTINPNNQNVVGEEENNVLNKDLDSGDLEIEVIQLDKDTDVEESELETIISNAEEITNYSDDAISQNGLPPLYLAPDSLSPISSVDERIESDETELFDEPAISFTREDISYVIMPDNLKVISDIASAPDESDQDKSDQDKSDQDKSDQDKSDQDKSDQDKSLENSVAETEVILPETIILESSEAESSISEKSELESSEDEDVESQESELEIATPELATPELAEIEKPESCAAEELEPVTSKTDFLSEIQSNESAIPAPEIIRQEVLESEIKESEVESLDESQTGFDTTIDFSHNNEEEEEEPAIEPQFMETILEIAGNDLKATEFLLNVIDSYLEETPLLVQSIDRALAVDDRARLLQALNTLRSSSDYIGALTLSYQCRQLELAIRANYVVLIYACLSQVAIEAQRATDALRIARSRYAL